MGLHSRGRLVLVAGLLFSGCLFGQQQAGGITARSKPDSYAVHVSADGHTFAASLLTSEQVKHTFASDISKRYLVFEIACYPESGASVDLRPDAFIADGRDRDVVRPADAMTVAARMEQKATPNMPSQMGNIETEANIGYETGTDPYTGRRVHGTYAGTGVGVNNYPDRGPQRPDSTDWGRNMETLQRQLEDRALPGGKFDHPVAGYLYFPIALVKKPGKDGYQLKYDANIADAAVLVIPSKTK